MFTLKQIIWLYLPNINMLLLQQNKITNNLIYAIVSLLSASILVSTIFHFNSYNIIRIAINIIIICFIIYSMLINKKRYYTINNNIIALLIILITTLLQTYNPLTNISDSIYNTLQQIFISTSFILYLIFFILVKDILKNKAKAFYISMLLSSLIIEVSILIVTYFNNFNHAIILLFYNIRILNQIQVIIIPSLYILFLYTKNKLFKLLTMNSIIFNLIILINTGARGTTISLIAIFLFYIFKTRKQDISKKLSILITSTILTSISIYLLLYHYNFFSHSDTTHFKMLFNTDGRMAIFKTEMLIFAHIKYYISAIGFTPHNTFNIGHFHPHNIFLYMLNGGGIIAAVLFFFITAKYFLHISSKQHLHIVIPIAYLLYSLVTGTVINPLLTLFILFYLVTFPLKIQDSKTLKIDTYYLKIFMLFIVVLNIYSLYGNLDYIHIYDKKHTHNKQSIYGEGFFITNINLLKK